MMNMMLEHRKTFHRYLKKGHLIDRADFTQTDNCIDRKKFFFRENFRIWVNTNMYYNFGKKNLGDRRKKSLWFIIR